MNVVDSSAWVSYFASDKNATVFAEPIEELAALLVPSITIKEVFKTVLRQRGEENVEEPSSRHFYWPDLDVDLTEEIIEHPERFPNVAKGTQPTQAWRCPLLEVYLKRMGCGSCAVVARKLPRITSGPP